MNSLQAYVNDLVGGKLTKEEFMKYELARFESFKGFPEQSIAMPLRLAQAGFYYKNNFEEAECFECGLKYSAWDTNETPFDVHKRLSPSCKFVTGNGTKNVPIHNDGIIPNAKCHHESVSENKSNLSRSTSETCERMKVQTNSTVQKDVTSNKLTSVRKQTSDSSDRTTDESPKSTETAPPINENEASTTEQQTQNTTNHMVQNKEVRSNDTEWPLARFPDYVMKSKRLESFSGWIAKSQNQTADELAEAGLVYTGVRDCVRCFHCGGGLQGWEAGDQPWIEHARWFPDCGYVLKCKGVDFVRKHHGPLTIDENEVSESDPNDVAKQTLVETGYVTKGAEQKSDNGSNDSECSVSANQTSSTTSPSQVLNEQDIIPVLEENERLRRQILCKICLDQEAGVVFLPCGHLVACPQCAAAIRKCPMCRKRIKHVVRTYIS